MNKKLFKEKVAIVTGSSMGIGKAIAIVLAEQGAQVMLNGRDKKKLRDTEKELKQIGLDVSAFQADICDPEQCKYLIEETINCFGKINILINNAGLSSRGSVMEMAPLNFKALMETNYSGTAYMCKYAFQHLKKTKGNLIFINSVGAFRGMPYNSAYTASKMAQSALADALRIELYDYGIHVGVAYVGFTENDPKKTILDVDGSLVYLPKRTNVSLAKPNDVAKSVCQMILSKKNSVTLTGLGLLAQFTIRYFPRLSHWILWKNREKIKTQYALIGGIKIPKPL
ncbi:short-subunit dehydrogenase [Saonia flava]|uniref:Short-subunit dehydrogenase n=1 Tax=Saonia flava TaxID=523696 RepID=A0A846QXU7_9FLAO|nr:SDR family NAD(P)-dependent oxidoreductase [Saonia flava]NJB71770.1 short-subunit dehydrogenase [Saonia flava]